MLSEMSSKLDLSLSLREEEGPRQHTHVLQQDHAGAIERDEMMEIEDKFKKLLLDYQICETECGPDAPFEHRMKYIQNELTVKYCHEQHLSMGSLFSLENMTLTEQFSILKAVTQLTLDGGPDAVSRDVHQPQWDNFYTFHLRILEQLGGLNPTLAAKLLLPYLESFANVSQTSKDLLSQILFSNIWTAVEIMFFLQGAASMANTVMDSILQTVQTYRLDLLTTLSAIRDEDPTNILSMYAEEETDKDIDYILSEMQDVNYPEKFLSVIEDVLVKITEVVSKHKEEDERELDRRERREKIKDLLKNLDLDLAKPDITVLSEVLIGMSLAVRECSTITNQSGENIEGYFPRLTQLASVLMLLLSQATANKGCLLEIGKGEGKSCILAMFAVIQAIRGAKVDIVTSSAVLARRDQDEWKKLYDMFDITSSVVPPPTLTEESASRSHDERLQDAYNQRIVYGTVGDFAADILKQEFEKNITRGEREFDLVIVDEVDYMTLDSGIQVTFLSHDTSGMRHVEQVLAAIWLMMSTCRPIVMEETGETEWITGIQHFHKAAKMAIMGSDISESFTPFDILLPGLQLGFYTEEDIDGLMQGESEAPKEGKGGDFQDETWNTIEAFMTKVGVEQQYDLLTIFETALDETVSIDCYTVADNKVTPFGERKPDRDMNIKMLLLENGRASEIMSEKSLIDASVHELKLKIKYSDQCEPNSKETEKSIVIPFMLRGYLENRLPVFVGNALKAIAMTQGREYKIDMSSAAFPGTISDSDKHLYHAIIPVDYQASGVLEKNKRWGDGLLQFLEMKHQLAVTSVTNYNHYFQRYLTGRGIFGVSGTLGGNADKEFLKKHYKTDNYIIPAHRHNKLVELPALHVSGDSSNWTKAICDAAWRAADRGQVVLVVCEDVKTANELQMEMDNRKASLHHPITMYTISERDNIEQTTFRKGNIIIATNLGGRGTDIKVEHEVNQCGGLLVLLTHFPSNQRVEKQAFGRTARKGNPGMVQMILHWRNLAPAYQGQSVEVMRELRERYEIQRIACMENKELKLTREPDRDGSDKSLFSKLKDQMGGVHTPHTGHYTIVHPGGQAVVQATSGGHQQNVNSKVQKQVKRQRTTQQTDDTAYFDAMASEISPGTAEYAAATTNKLGYVGTYKKLKNTIKCKKGEVEKDHIIPMEAIHMALSNAQFQNLKNKKMHDLVKSATEDQNGENQLTMQVEYRHHRTALTTGRYGEAKECRKLLTETLLTGDAEKLIKQSIIMGHPQSSRQLRHDTGIDRSSLNHPLNSQDAYYYKVGHARFIDKYQAKGIINQYMSQRLKKWVKEEIYLDRNTSEYREIKDRIRPHRNTPP